MKEQGKNRLNKKIKTVTQVPVSRYLAQDAENISHATVSGTTATVDVLHYSNGEVLFPYTISQYGGFGHTDQETNELNP